MQHAHVDVEVDAEMFFDHACTEKKRIKLTATNPLAKHAEYAANADNFSDPPPCDADKKRRKPKHAKVAEKAGSCVDPPADVEQCVTNACRNCMPAMDCREKTEFHATKTCDDGGGGAEPGAGGAGGWQAVDFAECYIDIGPGRRGPSRGEPDVGLCGAGFEASDN